MYDTIGFILGIITLVTGSIITTVRSLRYHYDGRTQKAIDSAFPGVASTIVLAVATLIVWPMTLSLLTGVLIGTVFYRMSRKEEKETSR